MRWPVAVGLATALVWFQLPDLPLLARIWAALLLVPLPALMVWQARMLRDMAELPRRDAYVSSIVALWALAGITLAVVTFGDIGLAAVGVYGVSPAPFLAWTAGLTVAAVAVLFLFRALGFREAVVTRELLPATRAERRWFVLVSLSAGICEEFIFRGFLLHVLAWATGSTALAVIISSGAFGVLHAYQQPTGALRAAMLGALLAVPLLVSQPIHASIAAHAVIDVIAGLWLHRYLLR